MYDRIISFVREQPWAILPEKLAIMADLLRFRAGGGRLTPEEVQSRIGARRERQPFVRLWDGSAWEAYQDWPESRAAGPGAGGRPVVAVLGVYGIISQRASQVDDMSGPGGTSTEKLGAAFRAALADNAVQAIVLDVDSPGGGVYGVQELADEIRAARGQKPIVAVSNSLTASAAYWLASQADELVVTPSGEVGSVGVYSAHEDMSKMLETDGVKVTLVSAGKYKVEGNPFEPLTEDARAFMQARVDDYYKAFTTAVAKGRGVSVEDVRKGFGQGRVVGAKQAVEERMADRVDTLDETIRRVARGGGKSKAAKADLATALTAHAQTLTATAARLRAEDDAEAQPTGGPSPEQLAALEELKSL